MCYFPYGAVNKDVTIKDLESVMRESLYRFNMSVEP